MRLDKPTATSLPDHPKPRCRVVAGSYSERYSSRAASADDRREYGREFLDAQTKRFCHRENGFRSLVMTRISPSHPPLASLRVFEVAARRGSYKAAAASLNLTASAVSYQIRLLESYLGVQLFERSGRNLVLTSNGTAYSEAVRRVFVDLAEAESLLKGNKRNKSSNIVRVSATPTFAALAAVPNLGKFKAAYPKLDLIIEGRNLSVDLASEPLDAAIHVGTPPLRGLVADRLFRTRMTPLMSPQLAASSSPIRNARDLARFPLIEISKFENLWERWFSEHDPSMQMTKPRVFSDSLSTAIQMANPGLGIIRKAGYPMHSIR
jgi:LysR family transcriptional regulator, glycine cleavage system transcriptional activator